MTPAGPERPYVGLRPYEEKDRAVFFGRDQESVVLVDKILGSPVTVLYALSGTGKTSVLRARVIDELRELSTRVVFVDSWVSEPVAAIRQTAAKALGAEIGGRGGQSLLELSRALRNKGGEGLVVILDQLEQLFLRQPDRVGALAQEIASLVRLGPDAHVVLSVREEYLGRIDALRERLLTVTMAQHRLAPLAGQGAREAILRPLELFGGKMEGALLATLPEDLCAKGEAAGLIQGAISNEGVSLPLLQIVCSRLWEASRDDPGHEITASLYRKLGGHEGIVRDYVEGVVSTLSPDERLDMARVLNLLAPKAGVKMTFPVDVLAAQSHLDEGRVKKLLAHLEEHRIVRPREGGTVELYHDAFIDVLRGFIEKELRADEAIKQVREESRKRELEDALGEARAARRLRALSAGLALAVVVAGALLVGYLGKAKLAQDKANEAQQQAALAEEASRRAQANEAQARELAGQVAAKEKEARERLQRIERAVEVKKTFAGGNLAAIKALAVKPGPNDLRFAAIMLPRGSMFTFKIFPREDVPGKKLDEVVAITYFMSNDTFQNTFYMTGADRRFTASYDGWGYTLQVHAFVEYKDPERKPDIFVIQMSEAFVDGGH